MTLVKVVRTESGCFLAHRGHQMVGTSDHSILSPLTSEKKSLDVWWCCHRQIGASCLAWPLPVVRRVY